MESSAIVPTEIRDRLEALIGKRCWYVSAGRTAQGASFSLQLGERVVRERPFEMVSGEFKTHRGEFRLFVWCTWRLGTSSAPLGSSDEDAEKVKRVLDGLVGLSVCLVERDGPAWELQVEFEQGVRLRVFADFVPGDSRMDRNRELWNRNEALIVGPGYDWRCTNE